MEVVEVAREKAAISPQPLTQLRRSRAPETLTSLRNQSRSGNGGRPSSTRRIQTIIFPAYERVIETIIDQLTLQPTGRLAKSTTSISDKLKRESIRLTQIQDIAEAE
jgi:hypothetical protein